MRWPWMCSLAVHAAVLTAVAVAGLGGLIRAKHEIPIVLSTDVRPEPQIRFAASRVVFSEEVITEPERRRPQMESKEPEPVEDVEDPPETVRPRSERLTVPCHAIPDSLLKPVPREKPEDEAPSPAPRPMATTSELAPPVPVAGNPPPSYPPAARRRGVEGVVMVRLVLSGQGEVVKAEVKETSGSQLLDEAALSALRQWRFNPGKGAEACTEFTLLVPVRFTLKDAG